MSRHAAHWFALPILLSVLVHNQLKIAPTRPLITQAIDNNKRVTLMGNISREAQAATDRGRVPDFLLMPHMKLILRLPKEKQVELERFLQEVSNPESPRYHKWLTPQQFKDEFSLAPEDIHTLTRWLRSEGFKVNATMPTSIDFSGTAGQVRRAFKTEIDYLDVNGMRHIGNVTEPQIPVALAPAVSGIASLNDFKPHPMGSSRPSQE